MRTPHNWYRVYLEDVPADGTPVPASGGGQPAKTPSSDVNWEEESSPIDDNPAAPVTPAPAATPSATPAPAAAPTPAPAAPAPSAPAAPVAPVSATPAPVTPAPSPVTPAPAPVDGTPTPAAPVTPATPALDVQALRAAEVTRLTGIHAGRLTEDVARGLLVEPEKHLPALLAQVQVDTMDAVINHMYASLPGIIHTLTRQSSAAQSAEQEFFQAWPALAAKAEYKPTVENAIRTYRQLNPTAKKDEIMRAAGLAAMITLRLPLPPELFAVPAPTPTPAPGFSHAAPSGAAPVAPAPGAKNPYALLNEEFDREE